MGLTGLGISAVNSQQMVSLENNADEVRAMADPRFVQNRALTGNAPCSSASVVRISTGNNDRGKASAR